MVFRCILAALGFVALGLVGLSAALAQTVLDPEDRPLRSALPAGSSSLVHFSSNEHGATQVRKAVQDSRGLLIFLGGYKLHQYDGVSWRLFELPIYGRELLIDAGDRLYVGGDKDFGYVDLVQGSARFISARDLLPEEARDVLGSRAILPFDQGVLFCTQRGLYLLRSDNHIEILAESESGAFGKAFLWQGRLYVNHESLGLQVFDGSEDRDGSSLGSSAPARLGAGKRVAGADLLVGARPLVLLPYDTASALLLTARNGSFRLTAEGLEAFPLPADSFLGEKMISEGIRTSDGRFVLAMRRGGVLVLDAQGELVEIIDRDRHPMLNNAVYHVFEDRQGNLWICTDLGIAMVPRSPARRIVDPTDVEGTLHRTHRHLGHLYFATRTDLYRQASAGGPPASFSLEKVPGVNSGIWDLLSFDEVLLAASSDGILAIRDPQGKTRVEKICPPVAESLHRSRLFPERVFAGTSGGLRTLYRENGEWVCSEPIEDLKGYVFHITETDDGEILLRAAGPLLYRLRFPDGIEHPPKIERYELPGGLNDFVTIDGEIFLSNAQGIFRYRGTLSPDLFPFEKDSSFSYLLPPDEETEQIFLDYEADRGRLWLATGNQVEIAQRSAPTERFERRHLASDQAEFWCDIYRDPEHGLYWLTNNEGVYLVEPNFQRMGSPTQTLLRKVLQVRTQVDLLLAGLDEENREEENGTPSLPYQDNSLQFDFAAPIFDQLGSSEYQWMLEGFDKDWSAWSAKTSKEYTNLREKIYRFRVRARDRWNVHSQEANFVFRVEPPIYRTLWAYGLYALALLSVIALALQIHRRLIARERATSRRLREVDQLKDEFLANTSHELRTPLFGMTGLAESMLEGSAGALSDTAQMNLSMIAASGRRLTHLVGDLLDLSKMRHQSLQLQLQAIGLHSLVDVVLTLSAPLVGARPLRLENAVPPDLPPVAADENRLQQILYNLVGNAIKFSEEGVIEVSAGPAEEGKPLVVRVRDPGIGIPLEKQQEIFQPFEQADASIERTYGGTGLGLAVTRQLVELHGGTIWVDAAPGEGATFSFSLPIASKETPEAAEDTKAWAVQEPADLPVKELRTLAAMPSALEDPQADAIRILVVDDELVNQQVLKNYLFHSSYHLVMVSSGEEALQKIHEERFDLVLLDVMMPRVSGFEVCRSLRETYSMAELPVLFLTAKNQLVDVATGLSLGANDFLTKPVSKGELLARMRPHLDLLAIHRNLEGLVEEKISEIKILEGLLSICASCKRICDDGGTWNEVETFIAGHSEAEFSHGVCPDCAQELYPSYLGKKAE